MKTLILKSQLTDDEVKELRGEFIGEDYYTEIIDDDCDVYTEDDNTNYRLLFKFRKSIIEKDLAHSPIQAFKDSLTRNTSIRGTAAGKIDATKLSPNIMGVMSPDKFKSRVIYNDGRVSGYYTANRVQSLIAGYYDKPTLRTKSEILRTGERPCRLTAFTAKEPEKWKAVLPLLQKVDHLYNDILPDVYKRHKATCDKVRDFCIDDTIFSTLTVNLNWRTACHVDKGDLLDGYSAVTVSETGDWSGCYLGYPKWGVCVDIREGDLLIKDPHQWHCNTELIKNSPDATRISLVYYFRDGIQNCV
jgi:hypothetical protein